MSNHIRRQPLSRTQKEKDFDIAAEKAYRKNAAKTVRQHEKDLVDFPEESILKR